MGKQMFCVYLISIRLRIENLRLITVSIVRDLVSSMTLTTTEAMLQMITNTTNIAQSISGNQSMKNVVIIVGLKESGSKRITVETTITTITTR